MQRKNSNENMKSEVDEMEFNGLKKLSEGILLPDKTEETILQECCTSYKMKKAIQKKKRVAMLCIAVLMIGICSNLMMRQEEFAVYAATITEKVQLKEDEQVTLRAQETPMGMGYVLEIAMPKGRYFYTITDEESKYPQNVFHKENEIYWLPDGGGSNLRDENGNVIELPKIDKSVINIQVFSGKDVKKTFQLNMEKKDSECVVTLLH